MALTIDQNAAFRAATENMDPHTVYFTCVGVLLAVLFLWVVHGASDVYGGWVKENVRDAAMTRFFVRAILLLLLSIWMFAS